MSAANMPSAADAPMPANESTAAESTKEGKAKAADVEPLSQSTAAASSAAAPMSSNYESYITRPTATSAVAESATTTAAGSSHLSGGSASASSLHSGQSRRSKDDPLAASSTRKPTPATAAAAATGTAGGRRLYIGNLASTVDEYLLATTFSRYGKISKMDFLFHKAGPLKGKPRGYAFVEYSKPEEALHAVAQTNDRTLRGKRLNVSFASASEYAEGGFAHGLGPHRHRDQDVNKPTTLSLLKNASQPKGVDAKIAAMEAKLNALRKETQPASASSSTPPAGGSSTSQRPPSLPAKPRFQGLPAK